MSSPVRWALRTVLAAGICSAPSSLAGTSLWFDEIALAQSIVARDLTGLLGQPLGHHQVVPDHVRISRKDAMPERSADEGHGLGAEAILGGREVAPDSSSRVP